MQRKFSYADQKTQRHRSRGVILVILAFIVFYVFFTSLFFSMRVLQNDTMAPNLRKGERFIFFFYGFYSIIPALDLEKGPLPLHRGSVVLLDMFREKPPGLFYRILDSLACFFTAQRVSLLDREEHLFVKRVIGLPGDEITMTNFVIRVKAKGSAYNLTEFEVTETDYTPNIPNIPALWDSSLPFSGNMERVVLGEDECFVLSDDRSNTNDSRTWGPVPLSNITGKALFRYWPFTRLGRI
jgi:signal peptidase I